MRKETSAGIKAGVVSSLPLAVSLDIFAVFIIGQALFTRFHSYTVLPNGMMLPFVLVMIAVVYLAIACLVGVIAGFIFVVIVNKFPVRSTYVKATVPAVILWLLIIPFSPHIIPLTLAMLVFFIGDSIIFGYLFNRWTKPKSANDLP
ncbi:MAG: hypothetical protein ABSD99_12415 [Candidatus Bathyarchaeia archaeon]